MVRIHVAHLALIDGSLVAIVSPTMKQVLFLSLVVVPLQALAQEPIQVPAALPAVTGKVLVLENERTLEGDIERIGDQYRVRRAIGETWLPSDRACACALDRGRLPVSARPEQPQGRRRAAQAGRVVP